MEVSKLLGDDELDTKLVLEVDTGIATSDDDCGMYIPLSDDEHRFVRKVHPTHANGHWECKHNSNPVATLPHGTVVLYATI